MIVFSNRVLLVFMLRWPIITNYSIVYCRPHYKFQVFDIVVDLFAEINLQLNGCFIADSYQQELLSQEHSD